MKNVIIIFINLIYSFFAFSQGNTKISINIPQTDTTTLLAQIVIENPLQPINTEFYKDTVIIKNGHCEFSFDIENPSLMTLFINDKYVTMPGVYSVVIEPKDNLVFDLPPIKDATYYGFGLSKINISGSGSAKVNMTKNMIIQLLNIYKTDPDYQVQSLNYKFQTTDRKLNVIDSIYKQNKNVSLRMKDLIKAYLYGQQFESLFRSANRSKSDSVRLLFDKYIIKKKRMQIFFEKDVAKYASGLGPYLVLSEFRNPVYVDGEYFQTKHKLEYAKLIAKRLSNFPEIRDYLLSYHVIATILNGFDETTAKLYRFYLENSDFNNVNYKNVIKLYEETEKKFAEGKSFYDFALPDSTGRIFALSDFKGKVIVFDFWFNGCGGCKTMVPALEEVEQKLVGSNVQFISIGIDNRDYWMKGIGKYSSQNSLQLYTNGEADKHPMIKYLNIHSYPRLIVVDKAGKILPAPPDPRSNIEQFIELIRSYL
ncbi:TlpA family protein disulfide reductase [uncultured Sphingobacterium sp.]|uniref:TlpA family protein disulfide reductase n=1 Tax=uncultured Sphingobacterium sp. TaxID=182688 RepID=UPI00374A520A